MAARSSRASVVIVGAGVVGAAAYEQGRLDTVTLTEAWLTVAAQLGATVRYGVEIHAVP